MKRRDERGQGTPNQSEIDESDGSDIEIPSSNKKEESEYPQTGSKNNKVANHDSSYNSGNYNESDNASY